MIADSERLARARLRKLPDGKWFSRVFGTAWDRRDGKVKEYQIACAMSKKVKICCWTLRGPAPR